MTNNKTAYIFGAGASVGATADAPALPTQAELLDRFMRVPATHGPLQQAQNIAYNYLKEMYPGRSHYADLQFEEVLGPLEWLEERQSHFHLGGVSMRNHQTISAFDYLLAYVLTRPNYARRFLPEWRNELTPEEKQLYDSFYSIDTESPNAYSKLLAHLLGRNYSFTIVSFNYDILLDRIFFHETCGQEVNYHVPFIDREWYRPTHQTHGTVPLIKPHGSLNWGWCSYCHRLSIFRSKAIMPGVTCNNCQTNLYGEPIQAAWPYGPVAPS